MVGIRASLEKDMARALRNIAKGSPRFQETMQRLIGRFVVDLASIKRLVPKLENFKPEIFFKLVDYWRMQGNQAETIQRKISLLRKLISSEEVVPTNLELGIQYQYAKKYITNNRIRLCDIVNKTVKDICSLQYYFGLKKIEAIHFCPLACQEEKLLISRKIAYNNKNRYIPIVSETQRDYLKEFECRYPLGFETKIYNERLLSSLHRDELKKFKIHDSEYFRYRYLKYRYQQLEETGLNKLKKFKQLRMELGYRRNVQIKEILKCHTKL